MTLGKKPHGERERRKIRISIEIVICLKIRRIIVKRRRKRK